MNSVTLEGFLQQTEVGSHQEEIAILENSFQARLHLLEVWEADLL